MSRELLDTDDLAVVRDDGQLWLVWIDDDREDTGTMCTEAFDPGVNETYLGDNINLAVILYRGKKYKCNAGRLVEVKR